MYAFVVVFDGVQRAGGVFAVSEFTAIGRLTAVCFQMLPQVYQILTAEDTQT